MRKRKMAEIGFNIEKELKEIKVLRRLDIDKNLPREISNARLLDGLTKFPEWKILKKRLIKEPRMEDLK